MLALKLTLVPGFLLLITLAGRRWGATIGGWLAGLPVVSGPILFFLAVEQGVPFAVDAAAAALSAIVAAVAYSLTYTRLALAWPWGVCLPVAWAAWFLAAWGLARLPVDPLLSLGLALGVLQVVPRAFPKVLARAPEATVRSTRAELGLRLLAGALLTVSVTWLAEAAGGQWTGLLSVFPVLGSVLAVFSHRTYGADYAIVLLRSMVSGFYAFASFGFVLALCLPRLGLASAFGLAIAASLLAQTFTGWRLLRGRRGALR